MEGGWLTPDSDLILTLSRMTALFGGLCDITQVQVRTLGDWDDPAALVTDILNAAKLPAQPRIAISDTTPGETIIALQRLVPAATFISATELLQPLRVIKSADELDIVRRAGAITEAAFSAVLAQLKPGMTELDIAAEIHYQLWRQGSPGSAFTPLLENSGPQHPLILGAGVADLQRELHPPVSLLFDFGAILDGYCYDFGRTAFFGEPPAEALRVHELVMAAQAAGIQALRAGHSTTAEVDAAARQVIDDAGYGAAFMHRLGHGIGMDTHEPPFLTAGDDTPLQAGMLFTVEPSIMQDNNYSARVEDIVVVRPEGGEPLTSGFQTLQVID